METTYKKSARSPEEWLRIIEECKASDLTVTEYCAQTGVGVSHYYRWRRRLHGKNAQSKGSKGGWGIYRVVGYPR
ncbi:MAG: transposase [Proteobacteria bacterium]|nr:transposase [Pseudomonadota bacterium]